MSTYLVEDERIELSTPRCKRGVFPLALIPQIFNCVYVWYNYCVQYLRHSRPQLLLLNRCDTHTEIIILYCQYSMEIWPHNQTHFCNDLLSSFHNVWCPWRDSNPHAVRRQDLNLVRLPIPPHGQNNGLII